MIPEITVSRIDTTLPMPKYATDGSFGFDLYARETTTIEANAIGLIPSNFIIECPPNLALKILPRSSTFRKKGLMFPHSVGLIDADFCGKNDEIMIQVLNQTKEAVVVKKEERIAQGVFVRVEKPLFKEIPKNQLGSSRGGFGSTGS